jgi:hypothetical protein
VAGFECQLCNNDFLIKDFPSALTNGIPEKDAKQQYGGYAFHKAKDRVLYSLCCFSCCQQSFTFNKCC